MNGETIVSMFCYQCEETAKGTGCTLAGVCGRKTSMRVRRNTNWCWYCSFRCSRWLSPSILSSARRRYQTPPRPTVRSPVLDKVPLFGNAQSQCAADLALEKAERERAARLEPELGGRLPCGIKTTAAVTLIAYKSLAFSNAPCRVAFPRRVFVGAEMQLTRHPGLISENKLPD